MKNSKQVVADGILDSAAAEFIEENLFSTDAVDNYADSIDVSLTGSECAQILDACRAWLALEEKSENAYYHTVTAALAD